MFTLCMFLVILVTRKPKQAKECTNMLINIIEKQSLLLLLVITNCLDVFPAPGNFDKNVNQDRPTGAPCVKTYQPSVDSEDIEQN